MTQVASNSHRIEINAPASTLIEQAFASLSAGSFGTLNVPTMNASLVNNGSQDSIFSWARRGHWDPGASPLRGYFYGCTHGGSSPDQNMNWVIRYEAESNAWVKETINQPAPYAQNGIHGYGHHALRQSDGRQFVRRRGDSTIYSRSRGGAWNTSSVPALPGTLFLEWNVGDAMEWYPDYNSGAGALIFASENSVYKWAPGDSSWTQLATGLGLASSDGPWICYNRADSRLYFGGGNTNNTIMRRIDPNGAIVARASTPFACGWSPTSKSTPCSSGLTGNRMFAINPSTHAIVEYNHSTNAWSGTIATSPFVPDSELYFFITIPNLGVIFHYISGNPNPWSTMQLWKR